LNEEGRDGQSVWHICGRMSVDMGFWLGEPGGEERCGCRWRDDVKRDFTEFEGESVTWIHLA